MVADVAGCCATSGLRKNIAEGRDRATDHLRNCQLLKNSSIIKSY